MAEKVDEMMATGTHRAWVGEGISRPAVRAGQERDASRGWLERGSSNTRHAAITRSLYSWSSYKSWTEKVRTSFDKDEDEKTKK